MEDFAEDRVELSEASPQWPTPPGFAGELTPPQRVLLALVKAYEDRADFPVFGLRIFASLGFGKTSMGVALALTPPPARAPVRLYRREGAIELFMPVIPVTLVISTSTVLMEWVTSLRRFAPHLSYILVTNVVQLRDFQQVLRANPMLLGFSMVLCKAGGVTPSFKILERSPLTIPSAIVQLTAGLAWMRVLYDDFDICSNIRHSVPAVKTIAMSATATKNNYSTSARTPANTSDSSPLREYESLLESFVRMKASWRFNVDLSARCSKEFEARHVGSTRIHLRRIYVKSDRSERALHSMALDPEVVEAVNAENYAEASKILGVAHCNSSGELLVAVIGKSLSRLRKIEEDLVSARAAKSPNPERIARLGHKKQEILNTLDRFKSNFDEGLCVGCDADEFPGGLRYVLCGCCQTVICAECYFVDESRPGGATQKAVIRTCPIPGCQKPIALGSVITISGDIGIDEDFVANAAAEGGGAASGGAASGGAAAEESPYTKKVTTLVNLVVPTAYSEDAAGLLIRDQIDDFPPVDEFLAQKYDNPADPAVPPTYLIVCRFSPIATEVCAALKRNGVRVERLMGSISAKSAIVGRFRGYRDFDPDCQSPLDALVILSEADCAGIEFPLTSHVIYLHRMLNRNTEYQAIGRAHRPGRQSNLQVVYIINEHEWTD